ncbi:MAG: CapA family protein [Bacteroidota bacterium]
MRGISPYFVFFIYITIIFSSCKTQKSVTKATKPAPEIDTVKVELEVEKDTIPIDTIQKTIEIDTIAVIPPTPKKDSIIITGVGDIMLGTNFPNKGYLPPNQGKNILAGISSIFEGADIVFGNLEGVILDSGGTQKNCRNPKACYLFRSPEYMGDRLKEAGFNLMSVANNHAGDFGWEGRKNTGKVLDTLGIVFAGNELLPYTVFTKDSIRYGFAAFAPNKGTPNINNISLAKKTIAHLDSISDIVIVSFHGGAEGSDYTHVPREHEYFYGEDRGDVYHFAHTMIDTGADIIFGHGPHVPRAIEIYKDRFIAYSLGNFATYARFNLRGANGLAPVARIIVNRKGEFLNGQIISCKQIGWGVPKIDTEHTAAGLIRDLTKKDLPEVGLTIDEKGFISYLHQ